MIQPAKDIIQQGLTSCKLELEALLEVVKYWKLIIFEGGWRKWITILYISSANRLSITYSIHRQKGTNRNEKWKGRKLAFWFFFLMSLGLRVQKTSIMKICLLPKRSDSFQNTLMFKQQSRRVLQYAQGKTVPEKERKHPSHPHF